MAGISAVISIVAQAAAATAPADDGEGFKLGPGPAVLLGILIGAVLRTVIARFRRKPTPSKTVGEGV